VVVVVVVRGLWGARGDGGGVVSFFLMYKSGVGKRRVW